MTVHLYFQTPVKLYLIQWWRQLTMMMSSVECHVSGFHTAWPRNICIVIQSSKLIKVTFPYDQVNLSKKGLALSSIDCIYATVWRSDVHERARVATSASDINGHEWIRVNIKYYIKNNDTSTFPFNVRVMTLYHS